MFKEKIRDIREKNNYTQEVFASKLFVSRTAVSKWETGKGYPSLDTLKLISSTFDITIDDLISDEDIGYKKKIDKKDKSERIIAIIAILLVLSLVIGGAFFKRNEVLKYSADSAMRYGLRGISTNLEYTETSLNDLDISDPQELKALVNICQKLKKDVFYFTEIVASFDYGISSNYNDYDCVNLCSYIDTVAAISNNFDKMTEKEIREVYDSLKMVCKEFNSFNWWLAPTDNYITHDLKSYDFEKDPANVKTHLEKIEGLALSEEEKLTEHLKGHIAE